MFCFQKKYFLLAIVLFLLEIFIAGFVHDRIVRPYIGDFLVVLFIYCFVKAFFNVPVILLALLVLLFAYLIETLQYFNLVNYLGLQDSRMAHILLGSSFAWMDMLAYTLGAFFIIIVERMSYGRKPGKGIY